MTGDRTFLERSLDDLEREHAAGDLSDEDFERLSARYRRKLDRLSSGEENPAPVRRRSPRWPWLVGVISVSILAGVAVARSAGQRLPTGGASESASAGTRALLADARAALGTDNAKAAELFGRVIAIDPDNVEARTYRAWIGRLETKAALDAGTIDAAAATARFTEAEAELGKVTALDPANAEPHCFRTIIRFRDLGQAANARSSYVQCVGLNPTQQAVALVQNVGAEIDETLTTDADPIVAKLAQSRISRFIKPATALTLYDEILEADAQNLEARTWQAYLVLMAAVQLNESGRIDDTALDNALNNLDGRVKTLRADAPNDGDAACLDTIFQRFVDPAADVTTPLGVCRRSVATPELRDLAIEVTTPIATTPSTTP